MPDGIAGPSLPGAAHVWAWAAPAVRQTNNNKVLIGPLSSEYIGGVDELGKTAE